MLQVVIWDHNRTGETHCDLCGAVFEERYCAAALVNGAPRFEGQNAPLNARALDICPACLDAGTQGTAQRIARRIDRVRALAGELETLAEAVRNMPRENWLTARELAQHGAALDAEIAAAMTAPTTG